MRRTITSVAEPQRFRVRQYARRREFPMVKHVCSNNGILKLGRVELKPDKDGSVIMSCASGDFQALIPPSRSGNFRRRLQILEHAKGVGVVFEDLADDKCVFER